MIGWIQEEYYDDIYGDLFKDESNGYFNDWLEKNDVSYREKKKLADKKVEEKIQLRLLKEKKIMMQKVMDEFYPVARSKI